MPNCPLYKRMKSNGTSFYSFPGASEDVSSSNNNPNLNMYFSKYVLLNLPKQNLNSTTQNNREKYFDFENVFNRSTNSNLPTTFKDQLVDSLRNYVANYEVTMKESRLNNTDYYYDNNTLSTPTEKIFWKWCKKLNLIEFEPANIGDEYFSNLIEFESRNINDTTYFKEILWKEREVIKYDIFDMYETGTPGNLENLEIEINGDVNLRVGDKIIFENVENTSYDIRFSDNTQILDINNIVADVILVIPSDSNDGTRIVVNLKTSMSSNPNWTGTIKLVYEKLVQYIGEVNGFNNVQEASKSYMDVYAQIPAHTGQTPDILFRTTYDVNYKPSMSFPIIPSQIQPEIIGAEIFSNPIVNSPQDYPGDYYGQFDNNLYSYLTNNGDSDRRSGDYFGIYGDVNNFILNPETIDGLSVDFNTNHYVKMNVVGKEITNFDQFNALVVNSTPPDDFEFNAILWYYDVEDINGNVATNLYGITFLDNPDNNVVEDLKGIKIPTYKKLCANDNQDGTSFSFSLNLSYFIDNENPRDLFNPTAINSLFGFNLYNDAMRRLSEVNDRFFNIIGRYDSINNDIINLKQLIYTQSDINTITTKVSNLESLIRLYSTNQMVSSDSIDVFVNRESSPPLISLNSKDSLYSKIEYIKTTDLYDSTQIIPINISVPNNKGFMINVINNDSVDVTLSNNNKLSLIIDRDLDYKQFFDLVIHPGDNGLYNKKLDIYINHKNSDSDLSIQTSLISNIDLPISYNETGQINNISSRIDRFDYKISDSIDNIEILNSNILRVKINTNSPLLLRNTILPGDILVLTDFIIIDNGLDIDFSGQYSVTSIDNNGNIYFYISDNITITNYISTNILPIKFYPDSNTLYLRYLPKIILNKGIKYRISRILSDTDVNTNGDIPTIRDMYLIEKYYL